MGIALKTIARVVPICLTACILMAQFHLPGTSGKKTPVPNPAPSASTPKPETPAPEQSGAAPRAAAPGAFDYYLLALTWAPNFCAEAGNAAANPLECAPGKHIGFVVHGLWPEANEGRSPESCKTTKPVSKGVVNMILPYMPSPTLIQHEWATHGTCSGLTPPDYFTDVMEARVAVQIPVQITSLEAPATESPLQIETQFAAANESFPANSFRTACNGSELTEVRVCFSRDIKPLQCPASAGECAAPTLRILPPR